MSLCSVSFVTIHPCFIQAYFDFGIMASASHVGCELQAINLRDYALDKRGSVDDHPYGGGDGMVMRPEPMKAALDKLPKNAICIAPSPSGKIWTQEHCLEFAQKLRSQPLVFLCGRFAGLDQRILDSYVDYEFSAGDYVVSGGELPALLMADSILRQCPGVLGNAVSATCDSFGEGMGGLLEYPLYTRPRDFEGKLVPEVLCSGDRARIEAWRRLQSRQTTARLRPDLLKTGPRLE